MIRKWACFWSWFVGIGEIIVSWIYSVAYYHFYNKLAFLLIISAVFTLEVVIILIYRELSVAIEKKTAAGVLTLLFVSIPGGILTLCIPTDEYTPTYTETYASKVPMTAAEKDSTIAIERNLLERGIISKAVYDERVRNILKRPTKQTASQSSHTGPVSFEEWKKKQDDSNK